MNELTSRSYKFHAVPPAGEDSFEYMIELWYAGCLIGEDNEVPTLYQYLLGEGYMEESFGDLFYEIAAYTFATEKDPTTFPPMTFPVDEETFLNWKFSESQEFYDLRYEIEYDMLHDMKHYLDVNRMFYAYRYEPSSLKDEAIDYHNMPILEVW